MRKITFGVANSLDNYIARKDGGVDWLLWGKEAAALTKDFWKSIDTILLGRKTFEVAMRTGSGVGGDTGIKTYVFSRTMKESPDKNAEIVSGNAAEFVRNLKSRPGKDICLMGGGDLAKSFFEAGLIDEIGFNIHPVLLGSGIPLYLEMNRRIDLELLECRPFENGCVYVLYRVKN